MNLLRQLVTANKGVVTIDTDDQSVVNHFFNPNNYADVVLDMFNNDRFYDQFFQGWRDLKILDIGGNIGLFSLYAQDIASDIWTLEPTPTHFSILETLTKDYTNIHPLNIALHNRNETIDFYISDENSTMNSTVNQYGKKTPVAARTLKSIIDEISVDVVDFIKCDIEGSEMNALTDETIAEVADRIRVWSIEVHATDKSIHPEVSLNINRNKIMQILSNNGYNVYRHRYDCIYAYKDI
jgi:FkbM family methyltransferase